MFLTLIRYKSYVMSIVKGNTNTSATKKENPIKVTAWMVYVGVSGFVPDMLAPAIMPVQLVNITANTVAKDIIVLVL